MYVISFVSCSLYIFSYYSHFAACQLNFMLITIGKKPRTTEWFVGIHLLCFPFRSYLLLLLLFVLFCSFIGSVVFGSLSTLGLHCESAIIVCGVLLLVNAERTNWIKNKTYQANDIAQSKCNNIYLHCNSLGIHIGYIYIYIHNLNHSRALVYYVNMFRECISFQSILFLLSAHSVAAGFFFSSSFHLSFSFSHFFCLLYLCLSVSIFFGL